LCLYIQIALYCWKKLTINIFIHYNTQLLLSSQLTNALEQITRSLSGFIPEAGLVLLFLLLIATDIIFSRKAFVPFVVLTLAGLLIIGYTVFLQWPYNENPAMLFLYMLRLDGIAVFVKLLLIVSGIFTVLLILNNLLQQETHYSKTGIFFSLLIAMLLGLCLMVMSANLLMVYLAVELVSICSYILSTLSHTKKGAEAGLKYLLFGAMSSGIMLYGMSLLYGFTGSLSWYDPAFSAALQNLPLLPVLLSLTLLLCGLLFKISAVPFHIWTPDIYEATPTPIVAFFSVAPKAAAFVVLLRFFVANPSLSIGAISLGNLLAAIALITLLVGNFSALWQNQVKRLLAFSSIAHAGFIFIGIVSGNPAGWQAVLFYLTVYLFMNFAAFLLIDEMQKQTGSELVQGYKGTGLQMPFLGIVFLLAMIALTGLPPTAGFTAKVFVFSALWQAWQNSENNWLLALFVIGLFNIAVALFYYLRIPFFMFFRQSSEPISINLGMYSRWLVIILLIPVLLFFFKADWLMNIIASIQFK
jgi:NADH-quinone oxidoreductase subunit N